MPTSPSSRFLNPLVTLALASAALAGVPAAAQSGKPVCDLVTEAEAAAVIGPIHQKQALASPDNCTLTTKGMSLIIHRLTGQEPEMVKMMLDLPANRAREGDVVRDEPGIGQRAVLEMSKGRLNIIVASGTTVWTFGVDHVYREDLEPRLPKLRELAKKVLAAN